MLRVGAVVLTLLLHAAHGAFYLPGVAPREFQLHEAVKMTVNKMSSTKTQLPYEYYALPFCRPDTIESEGENLGEVLAGDSLVSSAYQVRRPRPVTPHPAAHPPRLPGRCALPLAAPRREQLAMGENRYCNILCKKVFTDNEMRRFKEFIANEYRVDWCATLATPLRRRARRLRDARPAAVSPAQPGSSTTCPRPSRWSTSWSPRTCATTAASRWA